jgi:hypothetical protein
MEEHQSIRRKVKTRTVHYLLRIIIIGTALVQAAYGADTTLTYIPKNAVPLLPTLRSVQVRLFPDNPIPMYMGALVEQESCISLTHSKCWAADSELNTSRELGAGLFQITKAYSKNGKVRFDTLADLKKQYPDELLELTWENIEDRPDLQLTAGTLLVKQNYDKLYYVPTAFDRMAMTDSAYNGGYGAVVKARTACGMSKGCNPNIWFGNVENYLPQSRAALYGSRSAYDINREHVTNVMSLRLWKYRPYLY